MAEIPPHVKKLADKAIADTRNQAAQIPAVNKQEMKSFEQSAHPEHIAKIEKTGQNPDKNLTPDKG
jgi:hypothetical protein